jgi:hypothetical protein
MEFGMCENNDPGTKSAGAVVLICLERYSDHSRRSATIGSSLDAVSAG